MSILKVKTTITSNKIWNMRLMYSDCLIVLFTPDGLFFIKLFYVCAIFHFNIVNNDKKK